MICGATLATVSLLTSSQIPVARAQTSSLNPQPLPPSPNCVRTLPAGPFVGTRITQAYAALVARDAFFWAWPMVNIHNRRVAFSKRPEPMMMGPLPVAPPNRLTMLTDYIEPEERAVACPNQDVVYGNSVLALDQSPVVIQVPDFGDRFWVYQIVNSRTDSFASLGKMHGTTPGFYLLVGPAWQGEVPKGVTKVFRASTNSGVVIPRVFQDARRRQKGHTDRAARHHHVSGGRIRWTYEERRLEQDSQTALHIRRQ